MPTEIPERCFTLLFTRLASLILWCAVSAYRQPQWTGSPSGHCTKQQAQSPHFMHTFRTEDERETRRLSPDWMLRGNRAVWLDWCLWPYFQAQKAQVKVVRHQEPVGFKLTGSTASCEWVFMPQMLNESRLYNYTQSFVSAEALSDPAQATKLAFNNTTTHRSRLSGRGRASFSTIWTFQRLHFLLHKNLNLWHECARLAYFATKKRACILLDVVETSI